MSDSVPAQQDNARSLHDSSVRYHRPHNVIKNFALEICQLLFYDGNPLRYCWNPNQEKTEITIVDKHSFNLDQVNVRPAIVANRGPLGWANSSGFRQMQEINMRTDRRTYTDLARGGVILSCFSKEGLEAEDIAGYIWESFKALRDVLRKLAKQGSIAPHHLGFFRIDATSMGEEALIKSDSRPEISVVPISIVAQVQRRWSVTPDSRKLQGIQVRTGASGT
jgi:hypothetical protein